MGSTQRYQSSLAEQHNKSCLSAFTLIELLVVIAIILILISIAMPNFLEAQLRAKVAKVKGELHGLSIAMNEYFQDFAVYPPHHDQTIGCSYRLGERFDTGLYWLTTPIRYYPSSLEDPFRDRYTAAYHLNGIVKKEPVKAFSYGSATWYLRSCGPDRSCYLVFYEPMSYTSCMYTYCPTNGTKSEGDIFQWGGDPFWVGTRMDTTDLVYYRGLIGCGCEGDGYFCLDDVHYLHQMPPSLK